MPRTKKEDEVIEALISSWVKKQVEKIAKKEVKKELEKKKDKEKPQDFSHIQELSITVFAGVYIVKDPKTGEYKEIFCPVCERYMKLYHSRMEELWKEIKLDQACFKYEVLEASGDALPFDHKERYKKLYMNYLLARGLGIRGYPGFWIKVRLKNGMKKMTIMEGLMGDIVKSVKLYLLSLKRLVKQKVEKKEEPKKEKESKIQLSKILEEEAERSTRRSRRR